MNKRDAARALRRAIEEIGGESATAKIVGSSRQAVHQWLTCPTKHVLKIEAATKGAVTRQQLRPDLYPSG